MGPYAPVSRIAPTNMMAMVRLQWGMGVGGKQAGERAITATATQARARPRRHRATAAGTAAHREPHLRPITSATKPKASMPAITPQISTFWRGQEGQAAAWRWRQRGPAAARLHAGRSRCCADLCPATPSAHLHIVHSGLVAGAVGGIRAVPAVGHLNRKQRLDVAAENRRAGAGRSGPQGAGARGNGGGCRMTGAAVPALPLLLTQWQTQSRPH